MACAAELPNLVIVGAMKCATTALHALLDAHPQIAMAEPKELNFFAGDERPAPGATWHDGNWHRGVAWYAARFSPAPVRGEASPAYTSPRWPQAAARMAATIPDARLVYLVRDPIDRALSQYRHHVADGAERRPLAEALLDPASQYLARSRYHERLAPFLERFPRERIAVVLQEDLRERPRATLAALHRFAGVAADVPPAATERRVHVAQAAAPALHPALERRLADALADDVQRLRALTGRDLAAWRTYASPAAA